MKLHAVWISNPGHHNWISLRGVEWFLLLFGLAALDTYIWINASTVLDQVYADWAFDERLRGLAPSPQGFAFDEIRALLGRDQPKPETAEPAALASKSEPLSVVRPPNTKPPAPSEVIGRLEIPNLHLTAMVREGADTGTLRRAVGHIPGTALPGTTGNVALAGHRDTFFRALRNIQTNDAIELQTESGTYRYLVESIRIVGPRDVRVLASSKGATLTLVTCYPFYYIGSAPKRFIVRAALATAVPQRELALGH